jgi:hypothetical protein
MRVTCPNAYVACRMRRRVTCHNADVAHDGCVVVSHVTMRMSRDGCGGWFLSCEWFFIRMNKGLNFSQLMCFNNVKGLK